MYVTPNDTHLLKNWEPGWSGASWFKVDNNGTPWQAYEAVDGDEFMSFRIDGRALSRKFTYKEFEELFN